MTREELKTIKDLVMDMGKDIQGQRHYQHWEAYDKDEADSVMDEMEQRIKVLNAEYDLIESASHQKIESLEKRVHELEFDKGMLEVKADARGAVIKLNEERITMLKKHLEDVHNTMATENTDLGMENHKLKERIKELEASQPKWISVEDRLPIECENVVCLEDKWEAMSVCWLTYEEKRWTDGDRDYPMDYYTHWMPLPPLPTTEKTSAVQPPKSEE